jgi:hypothetical protein
MQPYFFPYIGYYQLIAQAEAFVSYNDAQYIRGGWSNRNRIQRNGVPHFLTFPVIKAHHTLSYAQRHYRASAENRDRILRSVKEAYKRAPHFSSAMQVIEEIMSFPDPTVANFNRNLIEKSCNFIGITTPIFESSAIEMPAGLSGQDRVIAICKALRADRYLNTIGGLSHYDRESFEAEGMRLNFTRAATLLYDQGGREALPNLSIIDVIMFNPLEKVREMLDGYEVV